MDRDRSTTRTPRTRRQEWENPVFEEIGVSAEATAYMDTWKFDRD